MLRVCRVGLISTIVAVAHVSATVTVTNTNDSSPGSLRQAIQNAAPGETITFDIPTSDPGHNLVENRYTIRLTSSEFVIAKDLTIDGGKQRVTITQNGGVDGIRMFRIDSGTVRLVRLTLAAGFSTTMGGAILNSGNLTLDSCTVRGNVARGNGGAIASTGVLTLLNSTISNNSSSANGAALVNSGTLTILNSTVAHNSLVSGSVQPVAGVLNLGAATSRNAILAANGRQSDNTTDVGGNAFVSQGTNLVGIAPSNSGFGGAGSGDFVGTSASPLDPGLTAAPVSNGGLTQTIALLAGSIAVNNGNPAGAPARDQRGYLRPDAIDIGAFEYAGTVPVTLGNLSSRVRVETGDRVMIGGFIITGMQTKRVVIRAKGPSLPVNGALPNPEIEIFNSSAQTIAANDNWRTDPNAQEVQNLGFGLDNDLESAVLLSLQPGAYTAIVSGVNSTSGVGLVEIYDVDRTVDGVLANISTRGVVSVGDNVMIGGLIVQGVDPQRVIVRAIGPSLPVSGRLPDPFLELYDANGVNFAANNNWRDTQQAEINATGLAPSNDLEAAVVTTLPPGAYTAIVSGNNASTGVGLVEVYALP